MLVFGQVNLKTYVPDDNFENILEFNGWGDGITLNDSVNTLSVEMLMSLDVSNENISDLTGIEDFTSLLMLKCYSNPLTTLDVSQNTALKTLFCFSNFLTSLDVSSNTALTHLYSHSNQFISLDVSQNTDLYFLQCQSNQLTTLDVSTNTALQYLYCYSNQLTSLDVSNDTTLKELRCQDNQLTSLDLRNGNNTNMPTFTISFNATNNPNLYCINVDDVSWSTTNWTVANGSINTQHYFSNNCTSTEIEEYNANKGILKTIDFLGRETNQTNQPLFYIYDDGTVEKKIILE